MNSRWTDFLRSKGAISHENAPGHIAIRSFGDPGGELRAALDASIVAPISHLGVLEFRGLDAGEFLQGQLSSDAAALTAGGAQASAYCSPKGRVLANFVLWRGLEGFSALLSRDLAAAMQKRLTMFVLRSKVKIGDVSAKFVLLGVAGPAAAGSLARTLGVSAGSPMTAKPAVSGTVIDLGGDRFIAVLHPDSAETAWTLLAAELTPAGEDAWRWLDIQAGIPWISLPTQDQFVPQMANLELTGAVNFQKGCYPGQEIVARTQYLGKLKRRLFRCHAAVDVPPEAAASLYCAELGNQACGMVVNAALAPGGGCDLLAVMQVEAAHSASTSPVRLGTLDGPRLDILDLPYPVPQAA
jgi:folate-binding protein YgfZ